jgi:RNA polymerase sigma-70 factor (ECF subfamily)
MASAARPTSSASREPVDVTCREPAADHAWVLRLIESDGPGILRLLWRLLGSEQDVLDAYQDTFCNLATRGGQRGLAHARAYAYRTAANVAIELIRVRKRRAAHLPGVAAWQTAIQKEAEGGDSEEPVTERLREALDRLPVHLRNVIVLRDLSRMSYEEVGRTLGIGPATARVYRRHAVVKLGELLGEGQGFDGPDQTT